MMHRERIDYHDEKLLQSIANKHPRIVWLFFKDRMDREEMKSDGDRYQSIPYELRELKQPLARDAGLAIEMVRTWYTPGDHLFIYRGARLLHNVFPNFDADFSAILSTLIHSGRSDDIDFVLSILRSYQNGDIFLHELCKEMIDILPENDSRIGEIEIILQSTGVVMGEFGFVETYQRKKQEIEPWLDDPRPKVRTFAERYMRSLDRSIASEQRRSEADYELRRREWDDNDE